MVWIEMIPCNPVICLNKVTTLVVVWIEMTVEDDIAGTLVVTTLVVVWIEIPLPSHKGSTHKSPLS